jgi:hypothetical protein
VQAQLALRFDLRTREQNAGREGNYRGMATRRFRAVSGLLFLTIIRSSSARSFFNSVELCEVDCLASAMFDTLCGDRATAFEVFVATRKVHSRVVPLLEARYFGAEGILNQLRERHARRITCQMKGGVACLVQQFC